MSGAPISRRTWLWSSAAVIAAACARPEPTRVPASGPEPPRELDARGAANLIALAELGAAIRWFHPSDQAQAIEWEPLVLAGVRELESAEDRRVLAEGLGGLFEAVAPTVLVWRKQAEDPSEGEELDEPACPDPDADEEDEAEGDETGEETGGEGEDEDKPDRARDPEDAETRGKDDPGSERDGPPARTKRGDPSTRKVEEAEEAEKAGEDGEGEDEAEPGEEDESDDDEEDEGDDDDADGDDESNSDDESDEGEEAKDDDDEGKAAKDDDGDEGKAAKDDDDDEGKDEGKEDEDDADEKEDRPPLPKALLDPREDLDIAQWHRRGFSEGLDGQPGCARRLFRSPEARANCTSEPPASKPRRRRRGSEGPAPCSVCDGDSYEVLTPAAPAELELGRGLAALVPTALWAEDGRTLPRDAEGGGELEPGPAFDEDRAHEYSLADRGTRLLAVIRCWTVLRWFFPHADRVADLRGPLRAALCTAAKAEGAEELGLALEGLLASFGDGNARLEREPGASRAFTWRPACALAWVEDRVVVLPRVDAELPGGLRPGDVVAAIDGQSVEDALAEALERSPAATASARIERAVAGLLVRKDQGASIELELLRRGEEGERVVTASIPAELRSDRAGPRGPRPARALVELEDGLWYVDATRLPRLAAAARRLRKAEAVILDLRGELADADGSLLAHFIDGPVELAVERLPAGPDSEGHLPLDRERTRARLAKTRPQLRARVVVLADARTHGRAELELAGFDALPSATLLGSASAGDPGARAECWLPGGWRLRFTHSELRRADGSRLWGEGVRPHHAQLASLRGIAEGDDELLQAARALLRSEQ